MKRLQEIRFRADLAGRGQRWRRTTLVIAGLAMMLAALVTGCEWSPASSEGLLPPHLQWSPCGGRTQVQWPDDPKWWTVEAPIAFDEGAQVASVGDDGGRLCAADGSVLELAAGTTVDLGATADQGRLKMALEEGSLLLLALKPAYYFTAPGCSLYVSEVPARVSMAVRSETTQLRVESGRATCVLARETLDLGPCSEIVVAPEMEPEISESCAEARPTAAAVTSSPTPDPTPTASSTASPSPTSTPTATATPTATPTATATPRPIVPTNTPIPTATPRPIIPTNTPTSPPPPPPTSPPPPPPPTPSEPTPIP